MDNTIVNVAIPTFGRELSASTTQLQWIVDAYTLLFAGLLLPAGKLGDRLGRRTTLVAGLAAFALVSIASACAHELQPLIVLRGVLGVCAALIFPATLSLITTTFTDAKFKSLAVGLWAATSGVGIALGPIIGGVLLKRFTWPSIFWINVPIAAITIILLVRYVPESRTGATQRFDWLGALSSVAGIGVLVWSIIEGPHLGWRSPQVLSGFMVAAVALTGLILWEHRCRAPLLDVRLFRHREFSAGSFAICVAFFGLFGFIFVITMFFQGVRGYSALRTGCATLPFAAVMAGLSPVASMLERRSGPRYIVSLGLLVMGAGFALVTTAAADCSYWGLVVPSMVLMAAGLALIQAPATSALMSVVPPDQAGSASAVNDTTREVGGTLGVAVLGSILASSYATQFRAGTTTLHLPALVTDAASGSVVAAHEVASSLPNVAAVSVRASADAAFMSGLHIASWVAACVCWAGAVITCLGLPRRCH